MASAKSFEEFVEEQVRQDGSGQVLRREGATGLLVPRGKTLTQAFVVAAGCYLCWEFRVKVRRTHAHVFNIHFRYLNETYSLAAAPPSTCKQRVIVYTVRFVSVYQVYAR